MRKRRSASKSCLKVLKIIKGILSLKCRLVNKCHIAASLKVFILSPSF